MEKKLDGNYIRMLWVILNKSWMQQPTKPQLYGHLPPITKTIKVRRTRHAEHCWRTRDMLISIVLIWTPSYGRTKAGWPARTYIPQLCEDMGCSSEDLLEAMNDREECTWPWQKFSSSEKNQSMFGFLVLFTNPSARAGYDTRSIFKRSLTGFEFRVFLLLD